MSKLTALKELELFIENQEYNFLNKELLDRDQQIRLTCIDIATRVVGKPEYFIVDGMIEVHQEDVVKVANRIYEFVNGK